MGHGASISKEIEPIWFIESKPCQGVPWCKFPKAAYLKPPQQR